MLPQKIRRPSVLGFVLGCLSLVVATAPAEARWHRYATPSSGSYALAYVPTALEDTTEEQPVIVFLHGAGATPADWQPLLRPMADDLEFVLVLPAAAKDRAFGIGHDLGTVREALEQVRDDVPVDDARISLAGHSAGGAWAVVAGYSGLLPVSGVFSLSAPYRTVLATRDPDHTPPVRFFYGTEDPNFLSGQANALIEQLQILGVEVEAQILAGAGHSSWPDETLPDGFRFLLETRRVGRLGCEPTDTRLCLGDGRFEVTASWTTADGNSGPGRVAEARTPDSGLFTFFSAANWELQVKVLDACVVNDFFWVFAAGTTDVGWTLTVRDRVTGAVWSHTNGVGQIAPAVTDVSALAICG